VQWRREGSRWVVAALGVEADVVDRVLVEPNPATRRPVPPDPSRYAAGEPWYEGNEPVSHAHNRYVKMGLPRPLSADSLVFAGAVGAVPFYTEPGKGPFPELIFIPVTPGQYQPYMGADTNLCEFRAPPPRPAGPVRP
jgi:hypothetical protein